MERSVQVSTRLSPDRRPGRDLLLRVPEEMSPTTVATRDLARYYALLEIALGGLSGSFTLEELEVIARALQSTALVEVPDLIYLVPEAVEELVRGKRLCGRAGLSPEECEDFLRRVRALDLAQTFALVDAVGRYLALPHEKRGEEGWKEVGLL